VRKQRTIKIAHLPLDPRNEASLLQQPASPHHYFLLVLSSGNSEAFSLALDTLAYPREARWFDVLSALAEGVARDLCRVQRGKKKATSQTQSCSIWHRC
jgi:hypothetical protein